MKVYYYQNGNWSAYKSGKITGSNTFSFVSNQTGKLVNVKGTEVPFNQLNLKNKLANAKFFINASKGGRPSVFAFAPMDEKVQPKPQPQPTPEPEIQPPTDSGFSVNWVLVAVGVGALAYFALNKRKKAH